MIQSEKTQIPVGPPDRYSQNEDLRTWLHDNFKRYGDIYKASIFGRDVYVVSSPEFVQHVLRTNWSNYRKGQWIKRVGLLLGNGLMVSEGEFWKSQRRMIQPAFRREVAGTLYNVIRKANDTLLEKWEKAAEQEEAVNVTRDASLMALEVVLRAVFGVDYGQVAPNFSILSGNPVRDFAFAQAFVHSKQVAAKVIDQRRKGNIGDTDILGTLMEVRDRSGQTMPDDQLVTEIITIIVAGHETTASTLNFLWYLLSQHPKIEERLSAELTNVSSGEPPKLEDLRKFTYTSKVIDETMRLFPPGWLLTRRALKDDQIGKYFVPAGTEIYISPYIIQRHPDIWDDPDSFNPNRFDLDKLKGTQELAMFPFSAGPRNCIGEYFANTEMQIHLITIAKQLRLRYSGSASPELEADVNLRSKYDLIMYPKVRI